MAEVKSIVTTYLTDMICDKCGVGEMTPTGDINIALVMGKAPAHMYKHACENCGEQADFPVQYPYLSQEKE